MLLRQLVEDGHFLRSCDVIPNPPDTRFVKTARVRVVRIDRPPIAHRPIASIGPNTYNAEAAV